MGLNIYATPVVTYWLLAINSNMFMYTTPLGASVHLTGWCKGRGEAKIDHAEITPISFFSDSFVGLKTLFRISGEDSGSDYDEVVKWAKSLKEANAIVQRHGLKNVSIQEMDVRDWF